MSELLKEISRLPGVRGLCLHRGTTVLVNLLPPTYGPAGAREVCRAVVRAFSAYPACGRRVSQAWFQYPEGGVLVLTAPQRKCAPTVSVQQDVGRSGEVSDPFLTILIKDQNSIASALAPARAFLARQAQTDFESWQNYQDALRKIMLKSISPKECDTLFQRILKVEGLAPDLGAARSDFRFIGERCILELADPTNHGAMLKELDQLLAGIMAGEKPLPSH